MGTADFPSAEAGAKSPLARPHLRGRGGHGRVLRHRFRDRDQGRGRRVGTYQARDPRGRSWSISSPAPPIMEGEHRPRAAMRSIPARTRRSWARSRPCSTPACDPPWRRTGATSTFHGFDRGVVYLHMQGACAGCPSSTLTLKMGTRTCCGTTSPKCSRCALSTSEPPDPRLRHIGRALRGRFAVGRPGAGRGP